MRSDPKIGEPNLPRIEFDERARSSSSSSAPPSAFFPRRSPSPLVPAPPSLSLSLSLCLSLRTDIKRATVMRIPCIIRKGMHPRKRELRVVSVSVVLRFYVKSRQILSDPFARVENVSISIVLKCVDTFKKRGKEALLAREAASCDHSAESTFTFEREREFASYAPARFY